MQVVLENVIFGIDDPCRRKTSHVLHMVCRRLCAKFRL